MPSYKVRVSVHQLLASYALNFSCVYAELRCATPCRYGSRELFDVSRPGALSPCSSARAASIPFSAHPQRRTVRQEIKKIDRVSLSSARLVLPLVKGSPFSSFDSYAQLDLWYARRNPPHAPRKVPSRKADRSPPRGGRVGSNISVNGQEETVVSTVSVAG